METWKCHICSDERPDNKISVRSSVVHIGRFPITQNVRYCNDKPSCVEESKTFSLFKEK